MIVYLIESTPIPWKSSPGPMHATSSMLGLTRVRRTHVFSGGAQPRRWGFRDLCSYKTQNVSGVPGSSNLG